MGGDFRERLRNDLFGRRFTEERVKYDGNRVDGIVDEVESRRRLSPGTFSLSIRRSFGD